MSTQINAYRQVDTAGKSQIDLILQVYSGAIATVQQGRNCYEAQDLEGGHAQIEKARRFIVHLYTTLDFEKGGEVAANLGKLYAFLVNELDVITATKDLARMDACLRVLENLRQGWNQLRQQDGVRKSPSSATTAAEALLVSA